MDAKLNQSDLSALLAKLCGISATKADTFTKAFFDVIIEGLESDGIVKINGLGTFKMVDVASRSSVNVNTGEKFEIKGHKKISFLPSEALKDKVNTPFAMFEPVEVDDDYIDDSESSSEESEVTSETTTPKDAVDKTTATAETAAETETRSTTVTTVDKPLQVTGKETQYTDKITDETTVTETSHSDIESTGKPADTVAENNVVENVSSVNNLKENAVNTEETNKATAKSNNKVYKYIMYILSAMVIAAILFYWQSYSTGIVVETATALVEQKTTVPVDTVMEKADTVSTENIETEVPFVLIEEPAQTSLSQIGVKDTVLYKSVGNMAVHRVGIDETLVKIAFNYYNDKRLWPYIVQHNRLKNFNQLEIGMEIVIPRLVPNR